MNNYGIRKDIVLHILSNNSRREIKYFSKYACKSRYAELTILDQTLPVILE